MFMFVDTEQKTALFSWRDGKRKWVLGKVSARNEAPAVVQMTSPLTAAAPTTAREHTYTCSRIKERGHKPTQNIYEMCERLLWKLQAEKSCGFWTCQCKRRAESNNGNASVQPHKDILLDCMWRSGTAHLISCLYPAIKSTGAGWSSESQAESACG